MNGVINREKAVVLGAFGASALILLSGTAVSAATTTSKPGSDSLPAPAIPPTPAASPLPKPEILEPPTPEAVSNYIIKAMTYSWDRDVLEYSSALTSLGASGQAAAFPLEGSAFAACIETECATHTVKIENIKPSATGWVIDLQWKLDADGKETKQFGTCEVAISGESISSRSCTAEEIKEIDPNA